MGFFYENSSFGEVSLQGQEPSGEKAGAAREPGEISEGEETQSR